jgi:hypothetical protein
MLAEITVDIATLVSTLKMLVAFFLVGTAAFYVYRWFKGRKQVALSGAVYHRKATDRSSDAPPPEGFAEHLAIIEQTAPNAGTAVWWEYAKSELTEAEVAIAEAKLARRENK